MAYPEGLLTSGERVRDHVRPHVRMLVVPAVVPPVAAGLAMWLAALSSHVSWHRTAWIALAVLAVVVVLRLSLAPLARWWCTHLVVTDRRLLVREGVVSRSGVDVAGSSIVGVRTRQQGTDRLFGCGTLLVTTRDAPDEPWRFHGIPRVGPIAVDLEQVAEERGGFDEPLEPDDDDIDAGVDPEDEDDEEPDGWGPADEVPLAPGNGRRRGRVSRSRGPRRGAGRTSR